MLSFFRKYQRYFFLGITIVIVISFSFFGTNKVLQAPSVKNEIAFRSIDGSDITQAEVEEMVLFLSMDPDETMGFSEKRTPRFLNDAVFRKDIIATGIGNILAKTYPLEIEAELHARAIKEKAYKPYVHPQASFISTVNAWANFAPALKEAFESLQRTEDPSKPQAFATRSRLYLAEKQFPPTLLRQVFKYQEKQFSWLSPDENLDRVDFSLFGYHTAEEWFGPRFMALAAQFVINSAQIAEQRGYRVSKGEAAADLQHNADLAFQKLLKQNRYMASVTSSEEYLNEQLRSLGLDESRAVKIWRNVLLFRKLFQDAGTAVFVDLLPFQAFTNYTRESAMGMQYQLPDGLQLGNFKELQKFELYLNAISKGHRKGSLALPQQFAATADIAKKHPELVEKRYLLEMSMLDRTALQSKVSLKDTWNWEIDRANWTALTKEFPELGIKKADDRQERFAALEALSGTRRSAVDAFARKAIVDSHPEWIAEALKEETPQTMVVGITYKGEGSPIRGLSDGTALIALLDKVPLHGKGEASDAVTVEKLSQFTADGKHYYTLKVLERLPTAEVLTFAEANRRGVLDTLLTVELEKYYLQEREKTASDFQKEDKTWKPFADVRDLLAQRYFKGILTAIRAEQKGNKDLSEATAASMRLLPYVKSIQNALKKDPLLSDKYTQNVEVSSSEKLTPAALPEEQWKLVKKPLEIARKQHKEEIDPTEALAMADGEWSNVHAMATGAIFFYQKQANITGETSAAVLEGVNKARTLFFNEVQVALAADLVKLFKAQNAISLAFFNRLQAPVMIPEMTVEE